MEVGSTKLEQVFKQLVNIPCRFFPARVVWDRDILTPTSINDNLFESRHFFQLAERLFLMAVFNFAVLCTFF